ncbi:hypothetical protein BGW39_004482 [Mortierella sp. 14UC]|nr:hypothetical protein BGW39_004482 [Mortierella sp. 14UC]
MSVSQDGKTLTTWNAGATLVANYSITSDSWTQVPYAVNGLTGVLHATTDPTTGAIYLPAGSPTNPSDMLKYTYATGQAVIETIPSTLVVIKSYYSFVWSYNGTKIILFGGHVGTELSVANIYILDIKSMTWSEGPIAPDTRSHMACAVSGDNFIVWGDSTHDIFWSANNTAHL